MPPPVYLYNLHIAQQKKNDKKKKRANKQSNAPIQYSKYINDRMALTAHKRHQALFEKEADVSNRKRERGIMIGNVGP